MAPDALLQVIMLAALVALSRGDRLTQCELAEQLYGHGIAESKLPDWVCLAIHESALNTSAVGGPNENGSYDFGIFQINSRWWCGLDGKAGGCHIKCSDLIDDDISDDIECAKTIYGQRGFYAWNAWKSKCDGKPLPDISHCFDATTTGTTPAEQDVTARA